MNAKSFLYSIGVACLISVPIMHFALKSWNETPEITITYEYNVELHEQAVENMEQIAKAEKERLTQELVEAELNREEIRAGEIQDAQEILESYQVVVPEDIRMYCEAAQIESNVCAELLEAVCWKESTFRTKAENAGCYGLMQISTKWHKDRMDNLGVTDIFDAEGNIRVGADYLAELFEKHEGDVYAALMEYNGDSSEGVSDYAIEICEVSEALERVHGK